MAKAAVPEPSRNLRVSDTELLIGLYPHPPCESKQWLEFRFIEDRPDGPKPAPVAVRFLQDLKDMVDHLRAHRDLAEKRAQVLRQGGTGPWPAALFWGVQPRLTQRGRKEHVAAFVAMTCDLDTKDWPELPEGIRLRAIWEELHTQAPTPSMVVFTGHGLHAYWLLREPLHDKRRGEEVQKAIARRLRGDHVADCSRLLRWPNSVNYKGLLHNQSRTVRVMWWHPELRYQFNDLATHFVTYLEARPQTNGSLPGTREVWRRFHGCQNQDAGLKALWDEQPTGLNTADRSTLDMALAHGLVRHHLSLDAFALIAPLAPWNTQKSLTRSYLEKTWGKAQTSLRPPTRPAEVADGPKPAEPTPAPITPALDAASDLFLSQLPESAWTGWAQLYRAAVGASTEAADEFHLVSLLTAIGAALGRKVSISCGRTLHPNLYAVLIGPTGDRKSTAAEMALSLLRRVAPEVLLLNGVGSQEGLMESMAGAESNGHSQTLLMIDEMASLLKKGRRESSGSLIEFVTEIFHGPDFKTHSTRSKAIYLQNPTLSLLGASTPAWLEAALEEEDILGGFCNRFIYVTAPAKPDNPLPAAPDARKIQTLVEWIRRVKSAPAREMTFAPGVDDVWRDFYHEWRRFLATKPERATIILRRIDLYILKFACIHAAMDEAGQIGATHLTASIELGRYLAGCGYRALGELGTHRDCRLEQLIEQKLQAAEGSMKRKHLRRLLGGRITGEKLDRILRAMEHNGIIRQIEEHTARGPSRLVALTPQD